MITTLLATALMTTAVAGNPPVTEQDTAAYAVGVFIAYNANNIDSTLDAGILMDAVNDVYSKNFEKKVNEAQAYLTTVQIAQKAYCGVDSTMTPAVIAEGIADMMNQKSIIDLEEADRYITNYIGKLALIPSNEFMAKVDSMPGVNKTESGVRYIIEDPGTGNELDLGDNIIVWYKLTDCNGRIIDSCDLPELIRAPHAFFPPSVREGIKLLKKGGKATLWMYYPSEGSYGGRGEVPLKSHAAFKSEIRIIDVQHFSEKERCKEILDDSKREYHHALMEMKNLKFRYRDSLKSYRQAEN